MLIWCIVGIAFGVAVWLVGSFLLGVFSRSRASMQRTGGSVITTKVYTPLLEIFKNNRKETSTVATISRSTKLAVLAAWTVSTFIAVLLVPLGPLSVISAFVPNFTGQFQVFAIFGLLAIYPIGNMVICFMSQRSMAITNLKPLAEDLFSNFLTFLVAMFSLLLIFHAGISFPAFPTMDAFIGYQQQSFILLGVQFPTMIAILSPFAMLAILGILPAMYQPFQFGNVVSKAWTPVAEFTGKSLGWVKVLDTMRFTCLVSFFIDIFFAGGIVTGTWWLDFIIFVVIALIVSLIIASVKARTNEWFLDKKIAGILRVHNLLGVVALILSFFLVSA